MKVYQTYQTYIQNSNKMTINRILIEVEMKYLVE